MRVEEENMKESGMEKLIELLNEYEKSGLNEFEEYEEWWYSKWNGKILKGKWENNNELTPYELYSKQYGFIQWLVENDKIDRDKNVLAFEFSSVYTYDGEDYEDHLKECKLLMLLSIQDNPIEFLISILK